MKPSGARSLGGAWKFVHVLHCSVTAGHCHFGGLSKKQVVYQSLLDILYTVAADRHHLVVFCNCPV